MKYISIKIFILSLAIGSLFIYALGPEIKTVYVYPSQDTIDEVQFKDASGKCFEYTATNVACPKDKNKISEIPIQTSKLD